MWRLRRAVLCETVQFENRQPGRECLMRLIGTSLYTAISILTDAEEQIREPEHSREDL